MTDQATDERALYSARDIRIRSGRVRRAAEALAAGGIVIVVDRFGADSRAALLVGGEKVTADTVDCLTFHGAVVRAAMPLSHLRRLDLLREGAGQAEGPYCPPVDHRPAACGEPSAARAGTITALADPASVAADFGRPGHVFPLVARDGGVLERADIPEASIDLARIGEMQPVVASSEITVSPGEVAHLRRSFESRRNLRSAVVAVEDLVAYRRARAFDAAAEARLPLQEGTFKTIGYHDPVERETHLALVMGNLDGGEPPLVRIHIGCLAGEAFFSRLCECGSRLRRGLDQIADEGRGALVYLRGSPHGDSLLGRVPEGGPDVPGGATEMACEALTPREQRLAVGILSYLRIERLRLLTDHPREAADLDAYGLDVAERVALRGDERASGVMPPALRGAALHSAIRTAPQPVGPWERPRGHLLGMAEGE